jgi:P-type conjugative transfer protein TrbJ
MKPIRKVLTTIPIALGMMASAPMPSLAQYTVFDPSNYSQNLLSAARALEQINNQIRTLQNEAQMILRMDQNLMRLQGTLSPDLQRSLTDIQTQLRAGEGIAMRLQETQNNYQQMFPKETSTTLTYDDALRNARSRWEEAYAAFQRTALFQGQIADGIENDTQLLGDALSRSRDAAGALEATQAGNELTGLGVKQSLALQGLVAAQARAETIARARELATEDEGRQRFKSFVGAGTGYMSSK